MTRNTSHLLFPLLATLAMVAGGCTPQPPTRAQANFDAEFTLTTSMGERGMAFVGVGGEIDELSNPDLVVRQGDAVHITLINGDSMPHDFAVPDLNAQTPMTTVKGQSIDVFFKTIAAGEFAYYCTVSGHRQAGMEGRLIVIKP